MKKKLVYLMLLSATTPHKMRASHVCMDPAAFVAVLGGSCVVSAIFCLAWRVVASDRQRLQHDLWAVRNRITDLESGRPAWMHHVQGDMENQNAALRVLVAAATHSQGDGAASVTDGEQSGDDDMPPLRRRTDTMLHNPFEPPPPYPGPLVQVVVMQQMNGRVGAGQTNIPQLPGMADGVVAEDQ